MQCRLASVVLALTASSAAAQTPAADHPAGHAAPVRATAAMPAAPAVPGARVVTITARDYAFVAPDTVEAGLTELRLVNAGTELHHVFLVRLDEGKTMRDALDAFAAAGPPPAWMHPVGGPNTPVPGGTSSAALRLAAGRYVMICVIPSADRMPHLAKGMAHELVVIPAGTPGESASARTSDARTSDVTMTLSDYTFAVSTPLRAGRQLVRVRNSAAQLHEVLFVRLAPGKTAADVAAWVVKPEGPPPGAPVGGTTPMAQGEENVVPLDLAPGEYAMFCFVPDATDGKEHIAHGMMKQFTVAAPKKKGAARGATGAAPTR
ncbi:MAG: hypothetical protein ACJ79S_10760 [Gemmatimonadaceae bacterium]